jgi:hypothetical protein
MWWCRIEQVLLCHAVIRALLTNRLVINDAIGEEWLVTKTVRRRAASVDVIDECPAGGIVPHTRIKTMQQEEGSVVETARMQACCICHRQLVSSLTNTIHKIEENQQQKTTTDKHTSTGKRTTAKRKRYQLS